MYYFALGMVKGHPRISFDTICQNLEEVHLWERHEPWIFDVTVVHVSGRPLHFTSNTSIREYGNVRNIRMLMVLRCFYCVKRFQTLGAPKVTSAHTTPLSAFWTRSGDLRMVAPPTFWATYAMDHATWAHDVVGWICYGWCSLPFTWRPVPWL